MFMKRKPDPAEKLTVYTGYIIRKGRGFAAQIFSKGPVDDYPQKVLEQFLKHTRLYGNCTIRYDPENAAAATVHRFVKTHKGHGTEESPKKSHQSLGGVERWH